MSLVFPWVPDRVIEDPPEFANLITPSYRLKEQRANQGENPKRLYKLVWDRASLALRNKIYWHYLHHKGTYASFSWKDIPGYVQTPNLIPVASQAFLANQDANQNWAAYDSSTITLTQNQSGPDGELNATRLEATAGNGTAVLKYYFRDTRANGLSGETYRLNIWARKYAAGSPSFRILINTTGAPSQVISSEEWEEVNITGTNTTTLARQVQLQAAAVSGTIDAILAYPFFTLDEMTVRWVSFKQDMIPPRYRIEAVFQEVL